MGDLNEGDVLNLNARQVCDTDARIYHIPILIYFHEV
jgi:hypothetical protein